MALFESISNVDGLNKNNSYTLRLNDLVSSVSVLSINGYEALNNPWRYDIEFTSPDKSITFESVLSHPASLAFNPPSIIDILKTISSLDVPISPRTIYGVITEFSQTSVNKDEAHYRVVLSPRLALLELHHYSAIYQNQSVISVVEEILHKHGFTGVDYRLELNDNYPARELITQWQENDLEFIQRLLADVGIWFRFESHAEHSCDVLVLSDYEQGLDDIGHLIYKVPSGMSDRARDSVWDLAFKSKTVESRVEVQDYNYREAESDMHGDINTLPKDSTARGTDYRYGEHYKQKGSDSTIESGQWYAKIRHQQRISEQIIIAGKCNDFHLSPGQKVLINGSPLNNIAKGVIILSVNSYGDRSESYEVSFTAIPFDALKPYRPSPIAWPTVSGTIPARVTSPDNDTYGYIDTQGRYRVKFDFDLKNWKSGEESLWVRLAKPYAGDTYGFHFPLIDGTEVAIAFTDGNPDRPYIAHTMHDSTHTDHVSTANKHRNVIRTPANNKLRMDDKRGQEHIKLATEYGKTQLNLGHLVNSEKIKRGEGFELRTNEWGTIRAGKGILVSSFDRKGKEGVEKESLDADETASLLKAGLNMSGRLSQRSDSHRAGKLESAESLNQFVGYTTSQTSSSLTFTEPGLVFSSPKGIAMVTPDSIYQYAQQNILLASKQDTNIAANNAVHVSAGKDYSVFAKQDIKLFSGEGKVQLQAHNGDIEVIADESLRIVSNQDKIDINAKKEITIACGGAYIRIADGNIELYAPGQIKHGAQGFPFAGPKTMPPTLYSFPKQQPLSPCIKQFVLLDEKTNHPIINREYQILNKENQVIVEGKTDIQGKTEIIHSEYEEENITLRYK